MDTRADKRLEDFWKWEETVYKAEQGEVQSKWLWRTAEQKETYLLHRVLEEFTSQKYKV